MNNGVGYNKLALRKTHHSLLLLCVAWLCAMPLSAKQYCATEVTMSDKIKVHNVEFYPKVAMTFEQISGIYYVTFQALDADVEFSKDNSRWGWYGYDANNTYLTYADIFNISADKKTLTLSHSCRPYRGIEDPKLKLCFHYYEGTGTSGEQWKTIEMPWPNDIEWGKCKSGIVYFVNTNNWEQPHAYCWTPENAAFPGKDMTNTGITTTQGYSIWSYDYGSYDNLIFAEKSGGEQTGNLEISNNALDDAYYNFKTKKPYKPENLYLVGTVTNENRVDANKFSTWDGNSPTVVTKSVSLAANTTYTFRVMYYDGSLQYYRTNSGFGTMTEGNHGWWDMNGDGVDGGGAAKYTQITTTYEGTYTFRYDWAENMLSVDWPEAQCSGSGLRHFTGIEGTSIDYTISYDEGAVSVVAQTTTGTEQIDYMHVQWYSSRVGITTTVATIADGEATATFTPTGMNANEAIWMRMEYSTNTFEGNWLTAQDLNKNDANVITYYLGACPAVPAETNAPCMLSAKADDATIGSESVVLNVGASDDSGTPTKFVVTETNNQIAERTLTAVDGKITLTGLTSCTLYTFRVVAKDRFNNLSTANADTECQYKEVTVKTLASTGNLAASGTASASYLPGNTGEYPQMMIDGNVTGTAYTSYGLDLPIDLTFDLGAVQYVQTVRIYWGDVNSSDYEVQLSADNTSFATVAHQTTVPANSAAAGVYQEHTFTPTAARYVRISTHTNNWVRIYEVEILGSGECYAPMAPPTMVNATLASVTNSTATLNVSGEDEEGNATQQFMVNGTIYLASSGQIVVTGLNACTDYDLVVYTLDKNGTSSLENAIESNRSKTVSLTTGALPASVNLATGKSATSSYELNNNFQAAQAVDGNYTTRWGTNGSNQLDWIQLDLGSVQNIKNVRIYWQLACADDYEVQLSKDNITYTTVFHQTTVPVFKDGEPTSAADAQDHILSVEFPARYVRIKANHHNTGYGISIWELEVYGSGTCYEPDTTPPQMVSATEYSVTTTSAVLSVSATDDTTNPVWMFLIDEELYYAADGKITISGLNPCQTYTWQVYAKDADGNVSTNYKEVTLQTTTPPVASNLALQQPVTVGYENANLAAGAVDGDAVNTRWGTEGRASIEQDWLQVDLGNVYYIDNVKIKWEQARPMKYQILLSKDGSNWLTWEYDTAPTPDAFTTYNMSGVAGRFVKVKSLVDFNQEWGISIYELEVYGTGDCFEEDDEAPQMQTAAESSVTTTTAVLSVNATDDKTSPVTLFVIDGKVYESASGNLTIEGLRPCQWNTWQVYALDKAGNISADFKEVTVQAAAPAEGTNLALQHPVYSGFDQGGFPKEYAVDGDRTTRWATDGRPTSDDEWLVIDLEGVYKINRIEVEWEYGTSINYEFKTAYDATFSKRVVGADTWDEILTGSFSTFDHKNEQPEGAKTENMELNEKTHPDANHVVDTYDYSEQQVYGRYLKLESGLRADYASSLWEIRVYGECTDILHKPVMQWAEVIYANAEDAEIYVSALDYETTEENMKYKVFVTGGESGYKQLTNEYLFESSDFVDGNKGHLYIGGLIPDVPYEVRIYAIDEDGNMSDNYKVLNFVTINAEGCVFAGTQAYRVGKSLTGNSSTQIFQKGYRVTITGDENSFTVVAYTHDDFYQVYPPIIQILKDPSDPAGSGVIQRDMTQVLDDESQPVERTFTYTFSKGDNVTSAIENWTGTVTFFVKYQFYNGGTCLTYPITYNLENGCSAQFVIFHHDDKPAADSRIVYDGGTIDTQISYYRHFTAGIWEDITLPFEVDSILVYDSEDQQYYKLTAQYNDGEPHDGYFLLRKQRDLVSGAQFLNSWYDGDTPLPQMNQPYAIRFTLSYYADKYVLFRGHRGQMIASEFTKGTAPTENDQYQVYGNPTMNYQNVGTAYLSSATHIDEIYRRQENASVRPFETYVLASAATTRRMARIAPWIGEPDDVNVATEIDNRPDALSLQPVIAAYTLTGQKLHEWHDATLTDVAEICRYTLPAGCYLPRMQTETVKIVVR